MDIDEDALDADQYIYMVKASSDEEGEDDIYDEDNTTGASVHMTFEYQRRLALGRLI